MDLIMGGQKYRFGFDAMITPFFCYELNLFQASSATENLSFVGGGDTAVCNSTKFCPCDPVGVC
jgi:hypothetical protein